MKIIRIKQNGRLAEKLRGAGFGRVVDSPRVRASLGLPIHSEPPIRAKVSVIIPAYNVAEYLEDAVGTVLRQSYRNIEIVIVNDGSKDKTGEIADRIARSDRRVRVIHKQNAGLGAARNSGLRATTGEYVTFVDSDDQLTPRAVETMLKSLERTGSDFAIGAVERFNSTRTWTPAWVSEVHDEARLHIKAEDHPSVLWDVFVWNKLFRRTVWDSRVGLFPEGVLYEDQECTAKLYVEGATFDSLIETVYRWRFRDDGSSITQNKHSTEDLEDRLLVARTVRGVMHHGATASLLNMWYAKLLGDDLYWYMREVPRATEEFWTLLQRAVRSFYSDATTDAVVSIPFDRRLQMLTIALGEREDFERVLFYYQEHGSGWRTRFLQHSFPTAFVKPMEELSFEIEDELLVTPISDEGIQATLLRGEYHHDGSVTFEGFIHVPNIELDATVTFNAAILQEHLGSCREELVGLEVEIQPMRQPVANVLVRDAYNDHSFGGFRLTLPEALLNSESGQLFHEDSGVLAVEANYLGQVFRTTLIKRQHSGDLARLGAGRLTRKGARFRFDGKDNALRITATRAEFFLSELALNGRQLSLRFYAARAECPETLEMYLWRGQPDELVATASTKDGEEWEGHFDLPVSLSRIKSNYRGDPIELCLDGNFLGTLETDAVAGRTMSLEQYGVHSNRDGQLQVERYVQFGEVRDVRLADNGRMLHVSGVVRFDRSQVRQATPSLMLWHKEQTLYPAYLEYESSTGAFVSHFSLRSEDVESTKVHFLSGTYLFGMLLAQKTELAPTFTLLPSAALSKDFPLVLRDHESRVTLQRRPRDGGLEIVLAAPFQEDERGVYAQTKHARTYRSVAASGQALRASVLFETFGGRAVGDSPKGIDAALRQARPDLKRLWTVRDHTVSVPAGATPVIRYSKQWYEALATSQYLVNNNNFPAFFIKAPKQFYVQTWHGTPMKRIGNDVPAANLSLLYRETMKREVEQWDVLLAQSQWAGVTLARAFGYEGDMFVEGYPRNDSLFGLQAETRRLKVRRYLGLRPDQRVVLYAPTWRDNLRDGSGKYKNPVLLTPKHVSEAFGRDGVLLIRGHSNTVRSAETVNGSNSIDVSSYPDVNDLMLAADVLVTDYSSIQFDFVNTGKPIIFLVPDLEEYRDSVRGFYLDFETTVPGPIARTAEDVVEVLRVFDVVERNYAERYETFVKRFAPDDDGASSERFVDEFLQP
ncbi:CDP-glycerol glycerophosphotransferase (TagB/SpsB family) [Leucobacter komagatae]|uniref:CDP-glycerol glycerophosphotransferase (TagB/SpsB family) n=1 Tax=Leucobacter komagatae TaxID=55969 RepID=A0A542Y8V1_9MICO|nr:CDP-glycerol glycerophosphotransferase family protein [Leucobacter komagatae]TQL44487.1 CDP-glycerol glycerophosphotransferase (TagB/SpsB family) [Leucobacter komagatae]